MTPTEMLLGAIVPARADRLARSLWLPEAAFEIRPQRVLFGWLKGYYETYRAVIPVAALRKKLEVEEAGLQRAVAELWALLNREDVSDDQFQWALQSTHEDWRQRAFYSGLEGAVSALGVGQFDKAKQAVVETLRQIETVSPVDASPVDLTDALGRILSGYGAGSSSAAFRLGIDALDVPTGGGPALGELWLVAAYAGEGKTTFAANVITYRALLAGHNVLYATGETLPDLILRRMVVRHTRDPKFGTPSGVDGMGVRRGTLSATDAEVFRAAATDLTSGENNYGRLRIFQMPLRATFDYIVERLGQFEAENPVTLLVVDSIDMVRVLAEHARGTSTFREQISTVIEDFKQLAISHASGRGLLVVSPYQVKRTAYENALDAEGNARYDLSCLSDTATAERRSDVVVSLLRVKSDGRLTAQILKNRDGPVSEFQLEIDDRSHFIGPSTGLAVSRSGHSTAIFD